MDGIYLTKSEQKILAYWTKYEAEKKEPPTFNQAKADLQYKTHSYIALCVYGLVAKGLMTKKQVKGRMGNVYSVVRD